MQFLLDFIMPYFYLVGWGLFFGLVADKYTKAWLVLIVINIIALVDTWHQGLLGLDFYVFSYLSNLAIGGVGYYNWSKASDLVHSKTINPFNEDWKPANFALFALIFALSLFLNPTWQIYITDTGANTPNLLFVVNLLGISLLAQPQKLGLYVIIIFEIAQLIWGFIFATDTVTISSYLLGITIIGFCAYAHKSWATVKEA